MTTRFHTMRIFFLAAIAILLASAPAFAQTCIGRPMSTKSAVGLHYSNANVGDSKDDLSLYSYEVEYLRNTSLFGYGNADNSVLRVALGMGDLKPSMTSESGAAYLGALYTMDSEMDPALTHGLAVCLTTGLEFQMYDTGIDVLGVSIDRSYLSLPIQLNVGYPIEFTKGQLIPFTSPTLNVYTARWTALGSDWFGTAIYEYEKRGTDFYLDLGAGFATGPLIIRAIYRIGDNYYDEKSRVAINVDVAL